MEAWTGPVKRNRFSPVTSEEMDELLRLVNPITYLLPCLASHVFWRLLQRDRWLSQFGGIYIHKMVWSHVARSVVLLLVKILLNPTFLENFTHFQPPCVIWALQLGFRLGHRNWNRTWWVLGKLEWWCYKQPGPPRSTVAFSNTSLTILMNQLQDMGMGDTVL